MEELHANPEPSTRSSEDDRILAALERIGLRLDRLEARIEPAAQLYEEAPQLAATAGDVFDAWALEKGDVDARLRRALSLLDRLSDPKTLERLEKGLDLVDTLPDQLATMGDIADATLAKIPDFDARLRGSLALLEKVTEPALMSKLQQGLAVAETLPDQLATMGDIADATLAKIPDLDARLRAGLSVLEKATEPAMMDKLQKGLELAETLPEQLATVGDIADATLARIPDFDARLRATLSLVEKATEPSMLRNAEKAIEMLAEAPQLAATAADVIDAWAGKAAAHGVDMGRLVEALQRFGERAMQIATSPQLEALLSSAVLQPETLETLSVVADSLAELREGADQRLGAFGLVRALRDPDVQRTIGFAVAFARTFGEALESTPSSGSRPKQLTA